MRRLLAKHPVHARLHADLVAFFEGQAEHDPERWAQWSREAVYHRFQLEGADAEGFFSAKLAEATKRGGRARFELIDELVGSATYEDYVDDEEHPRMLRDAASGAFVIAEKTLAQAWLERAVLGIARAEFSATGRAPEWNDVASALAASDRFRARSGVVTELLQARRDYVEGALCLNRDDPVGAIVRLERAVPHLVGAERNTATSFLGDAHCRSFAFKDATQAYRTLLAALEAEPSTPLVALIAAHHRLALAHADSGSNEDAIRECIRGLERSVGRVSEAPGEVLALFSKLDDSLLSLGLPRATIGFSWVSLPAIKPRVNLQRQLELADQGDLEVAVSGLVEAELELDHDSAAGDAERAWLNEVKGIVHAQRLDLSQATACLDRALELWGPISRERAARCLCRSIALQLRDVGSVKHAGRLLDDARRISLDPRSELRFTLALFRLEWQARFVDEPDPHAELGTLVAAAAGLSPRVTVPLALAQIRHGSKDPALWSRLCDELGSVQGVFDRLALLVPLERFATSAHIPDDSRERLRALIGVDGIQKTFQGMSTLPLRDVDFVPPRLRLVEVFRVLGEDADARRMVTSVEEYAIQRRNPVLYRRVLLTRDRIGWRSDHPARVVDLERLREMGRVSLPLLRATWIEHAERLIRSDAMDDARAVAGELAGLAATESGTISQWDAREKVVRAHLLQSNAARTALAVALQHYAQLEDGPAARGVEQALAANSSATLPSDAPTSRRSAELM
jgi:tetratricopeptide (TPR) repeat protein